jgi:hypothetical protein
MSRCRWVVGVVALLSSAAVVVEGYAAEPATFTEHLLQGGYGYAYGLAAGDLDGDGRPEITTADAEKGELSYFLNRGSGEFARFFIKQGEAGWFERHVLGDVNGDGKPDVVVVKNLGEELVREPRKAARLQALDSPRDRHQTPPGLRRLSGRPERRRPARRGRLDVGR